MPVGRLLALGDVHGCLTAFDTVLAAAGVSDADTLVTLGDYVDRGPDSRGVIERLLALSERMHLVALLGNHEEMMLNARSGAGAPRNWLAAGGDAALSSYGILPGDSLWPAKIPARHWRFLEDGCVGLWEADSCFFVHGGAHPQVPLAEQPEHVLHWGRFSEARPHVSGKRMVCGHTSQKTGLPADQGFAVCIDTYAHGGGWLTCLDVDTGRFWQANQVGEAREMRLPRWG